MRTVYDSFMCLYPLQPDLISFYTATFKSRQQYIKELSVKIRLKMIYAVAD